jgi:hypothetical protein
MPHQGPTAWLLQLARRVTLCPPSGLDRVTSGEQNATALRATLVINLYLDIKAGYATRFRQSTRHYQDTQLPSSISRCLIVFNKNTSLQPAFVQGHRSLLHGYTTTFFMGFSIHVFEAQVYM